MKTFLAIVVFLNLCFTAFALDPAHFTVSRVSSPYFVVDGNSAATGPLTAYVGFKITNTSSSTTYSNLKFSITSITSSVAGQNYTLTSPANGIGLAGMLAPGQSKVLYFYVNYPAHTTAQATFNYNLGDATSSSKTGSFLIYNRSSISANAGGLATQTINNQDLIGGIVYDDVTYTLGNIRNGDEADFQVSVSTQFDPSKLVLLKTEVVASTVPGIALNATDQLYFITTANQSSGSVTIRWTFRISAFNFTSLVLPYAGATSGSSNYKYAISTDLGSGTPITISSSANPLLISKTSDKTVYGPSALALFTVTIQNPGAFQISVDKITDEIPAGFSYQGLDASSAVNTANSTATPSPGSVGTVTFEGGVTSGTNISYIVPAGGSLILKYWTVAPSASASNLITNAKGFVGTTQFGLAQNTVNVSTTLPVSLISFNASLQNDKVTLRWKTSHEINSSHYEIERMNDNGTFLKIGTVNAVGSLSGEGVYTFIDSFPAVGINQYRLKMVDQDSTFEYSNVAIVQRNNNSPLLGSITPNPFKDHIRFNFLSRTNGVAEIIILDQRGLIVLKETASYTQGLNNITVSNLAKLAAGIYFLKVRTNEQVYTGKILK
jgi:hypothetical protein